MLEIAKQPTTTPHRSRLEQWLWQWCLAKRTPLVLFALIVIGLIAAQLIPQAPGDVLTTPADYEQWLQTIPTLFRKVELAFNGLGLFDIQHAMWFQALLAISTATSLAALGYNLYSLIRPSHVLLQGMPPTDDATWEPPAQTALDTVVRTIATLVGSPQQAAIENRAVVLGMKPRWAQTLASLAHLGLLLAALGIVIDAGWGWGERTIDLTPQSALEIGSGRTLELEAFDRTHSQTVLRVVRGGRQTRIAAGTSRTTQLNGLSYRVVGIGGLHVQVRAVDETGAPLNLYPYAANPQPVQTLGGLLAGNQDEIVLIIPAQNLIARLTWIDRAELRLTLSNGAGQRLAEHVLPLASAELPVDGIRLLVDTTLYPTLAVSYYPGCWLLLAGTLLVVAGGSFGAVRVQTVWVEIAQETERVTVQIRQTMPSQLAAQQAEAAFAALRTPSNPAEEQ